MKQAFARKVWWPLKLRQFDENGKESEGQAMVLLTVLDRQQLTQYHDTAVQAVRDALAVQQLRNMPTIRTEPELREAREKEINDLDIAIALKSEQVLQTIRDNVHGWRRFECDGQEVPFSTDTLNDLLRFNDFQQALASALREASNGARAKN